MAKGRNVGASRTALIFAAAVGGSGLLPPVAAAQGAPPDELQEVIVTAEKRSERLNDVPMSISTATGDELKSLGVATPADLVKVVPGFTYEPGSYGVPIFALRGIGNLDNALGASPAVTVYVDQVPLPFSAMTEGAQLDIERVEVLKGPQGTLFGQNSTGGAINYIAAKPTAEPSAGVDVTYGRFNAVDVQGYVSGPITDQVTGRLAVASDTKDNWQRSTTSSATLGQKDFQQGRLLLDWKPGDAVKFELSIDGWIDQSDTVANQFVAFVPALPTGYPQAFAALQNLPPTPPIARAADWDKGPSYRRDDRLIQPALRGHWDATPGIAVDSITAYENYKRYSPSDVDGTAFNDFFVTTVGSIKTFSQELRTSGFLGDRTAWMAGVNYQHDDVDDTQRVDYDGTNSGIGPFRYYGLINSNNQQVATKSGFGSLDFALTDKLKAQGSARYTSNDRDGQGCGYDDGTGQLAAAFNFLSKLKTGESPGFGPGSCVTLTPSGAPAGVVHKTLDQNNISWRGGLKWELESDFLLYANVTRGYKAGSFPTLSPAISTQYAPVPQEELTAYETGVKISLLERRLDLTGAAFYYDYKDKQILGYANVPPLGNLPALVSVPKSRADGFEFSALARPTGDLRVTFGASYTESRVEGDFVTYNPYTQLQNVSGEAYPNSPRLQLNGDVQQDFVISSGLRAFIGTTATYKTSTYSNFGDLSTFRIPGYGLVDVRAGLGDAQQGWRLELFGRNLFDKFYVLYVGRAADSVFRTAGMPVTWGVRLTYAY
jgi:iron complex outermembrane receptor protein